MIAFLTNLEEALGADSRFVHMGLTSSDVVDTALALQLQEAAEVLLGGLERFRAAVRTLALTYKHTPCVGRTHGIHAEPTTFGLKAAVWYAEAERNLERLRRAREAVRVGKISGAVGTFAHVDPDVEEEACRLLGLEPAPVSTQIVQRDRHAEFMATLAILAASLEKVALEIRSLQRTEILEAEEPFTEGQKGSSAMPHKRNPGLLRAGVRPRAARAHQRARRARERGPVARAGHQPLVGRARDPARLDAPRRLHAPSDDADHRGAARLPRPHAREHGPELRAHVLPARAPALTAKGLPRQAAYELVQKQRHARVAGAHGRSATSWPATPR